MKKLASRFRSRKKTWSSDSRETQQDQRTQETEEIQKAQDTQDTRKTPKHQKSQELQDSQELKDSQELQEIQETHKSQELQEEVDADKSLNENNGSNEGTKKSTTSPSTENTPIRELWKVAYEKLQEENGTLIKSYETELEKSVAASLMQNLPFKPNKRDQMEAILRIKLEEINNNVSSPTFKARAGDFMQLFVKIVDLANDYISDAARANPYTSIAWTGVSLVLPVS